MQLRKHNLLSYKKRKEKEKKKKNKQTNKQNKNPQMINMY